MTTMPTPPEINEHGDADFAATTGFTGLGGTSRVSMAIVSLGCAAAVLLALFGAMFALPTHGDRASIRGDMIAAPSPRPALTFEDVNPDGGVSNLVRLETEPVAL